MNNNAELIQSLKEKEVLKSDSIIKSLQKIDRIDFVPEEYKQDAYRDCALPIGYGQTISQPYTVAFMLELLEAKRGDTVLDIGSGSGWTAALLSNIVGDTGYVTAIELVPELVQMSKENISKYSTKNVIVNQVKKGLGVPGKLFDKILVSASANEFPKELLDQLLFGGTLVIPVQDYIYKVVKTERGDIIGEKHYGFSFVELKTT
jgi:protein-L-isoaspartate(D-aspartate) O-methyltransferase